MASFPPIEKLLPHRPPMLLIDGLIDCTETTAVATARIPADSYGMADGSILEAALVECVAQTSAAAQGYRSGLAGGGRPAGNGGLLAAVAGFSIQERPSAGSVLEITVRDLKRLGPMLLVRGEISCAGRLVAAGELTIHA